MSKENPTKKEELINSKLVGLLKRNPGITSEIASTIEIKKESEPKKEELKSTDAGKLTYEKETLESIKVKEAVKAKAKAKQDKIDKIEALAVKKMELLGKATKEPVKTAEPKTPATPETLVTPTSATKEAEEKKVADKEGKLEDPLGLKLDKAREIYAEKYKEFLADRKKKTNIFVRGFRWAFGSKAKDSEIPENLKKLEAEYDKTAAEFGQQMYADKKTELTGSKMSAVEQTIELKRYKQNDVFTKIIVEEQSKLNALKAENLPPKEKGIWKKSLDWFVKQPRWKKIAITTVLSTGIIAAILPGTVAVAGGVAAYAGTRFVRGFAGSIIGQSAAKAYDWLFKEKSLEKRVLAEKELSEIFAEESFDTSLAKSKKEYAEILERERKAKRERLITKIMITVAAGGLASYGVGGILNTDDLSPEQALASGAGETPAGATPGVHPPESVTPPPTTPVSPYSPGQIVEKGDGFQIVKEPGTYPVPETPAVAPDQAQNPETTPTVEYTPSTPSSVEFSSKGAIQTILDMREKIHQDYPDLSKAPHSVQEFMHGSATEQSIKLGMFDPNNPNGAESAMLWKGSTLDFDEHGNLSYHDIKTGETHELIHEQGDAETVQKYGGKMFDSDHSAETTAPETLDDTGSRAPVQVNPIIGEKLGIETEVIRNDGNLMDPDARELKALGATEGKVEPTAKGEALAEKIGEYKPSPEALAKVVEVNKTNINRIFPNNDTTHAWDNIKDNTKDLTAAVMMAKMETPSNGIYNPLIIYLHRLHEVTGLNPRTEIGLPPVPETNAEYINRALQKAEEMGKLDKVKLYETASNTNANNISDLQKIAPETVVNATEPMKHFLDPLGKEHTVTIPGEKGGSLSMEFSYDKNGVITDADVGGNIIRSAANPFKLESVLSKLEPHTRLDADTAIFKMVIKAEFLEVLPRNTYEYKFVHDEVAHMQKDIIEKYGNVLNPEKIISIK